MEKRSSPPNLSTSQSGRRWFFIAGREPSLSAAELAAVLSREGIGSENIWPHVEALLTPAIAEHRLPALVRRLGGVIKAGPVLFECGTAELEQRLSDAVFEANLLTLGEKVPFGVSAYGRVPPRVGEIVRRLAGTIKRELRSAEYVPRLIPSEHSQLSSVMVTKNHLTERGGDIVLIWLSNGRVAVGRTEAVQDFAAYSQRDYGRPDRSMKQGMLPPKIAQVMINLSAAPLTGSIWDPFCGSGTILQETLLMGFHRALGSDTNPAAVCATDKNLRWLEQQYPGIAGRWEVFQADIRVAESFTNRELVDAIVTEPDLGPTRPPHSRVALEKVRDGVRDLLAASLPNLATHVKPGGRIVLVTPRWFTRDGELSIPLHERARSARLSPVTFVPLVPEHPLLYHRPGQMVGREIHIYQKQK